MVPTYLDGGNGIDNGVKELMTTAMGDYLAEGENADQSHWHHWFPAIVTLTNNTVSRLNVMPKNSMRPL